MCWSQFISLKHFNANKRKHVGKTFLWGKHFLLPRDNVVTPKSQRLCHPAFCLPPSFWKHPGLLPFSVQSLSLWEIIPPQWHKHLQDSGRELSSFHTRQQAEAVLTAALPLMLTHSHAGDNHQWSWYAQVGRQSMVFFFKSVVKISQSPGVKTINLLLCLFCRRKISPNTVGNYPVSLLYIVAFSPFHTLDYSVMC